MMLLQATIVIGARDWLANAAAVLGASLLLLAYAYWRSPADQRTRLCAGLLKALGFTLLALCLVEPLWSSTRAKPGENLFLLVADNSASLQIQQTSQSTRGDWIRDLLAKSESSWQVRLAQDFDVRRYAFDARLTNVNSFAELKSDGPATSLGTTLTALRERYSDRPLAGILLFTDGNATDAQLTEDVLGSLPPVFPVLPPITQAPRDLSIRRVSVEETSFEDAPITVQMEVAASGFDGQFVTAQLHDGEGTLVDEARQEVRSDRPLAFRFQTRPAERGLVFYTASVTGDDDAAGASSTEATLANNSRQIAVNRRGDPFRILYVGGRMNWEFKFLNRSLSEDPQIQLVGLIRVAKKEGKFDFRGRVGESTNPLFRGFKQDSDEETEAYDQAVLMQLNVQNEAELADGFPKTKEQLYEYQAVILDDVEAAFFTHDQLSLLERFTVERGGGLMMLGGPDTFRNGGYARTPIADALPIYVTRPGPAVDEPGYRFRLTRDGWLQPWMRLRTTEQEEQARLQSMPVFTSLNRLSTIKPGARVMATVTDQDGQALPAIITQQYGAGRVLSILIGDLWRWSMNRPTPENDDLAKFWRQSVRWMVADVPQRLEVHIDRAPEIAPTATQLRIRCRDAAFEPLDNARLKVQVVSPGGQRSEIQAEPSLEEAGRFDVTWVSRDAGPYRAEVTLAGTGDEHDLTTEVGWISEPAAEEFQRIDIDRAGMASLAQATGGEVITAEDLDSFVTDLPSRRVPVSETWYSPLWHRSWMMLLVLACLAGEWGLRRLRGLP